MFTQRTYITCLGRYTRGKRRSGCDLKVVDLRATWALGLTVFRLLLVMCIFIHLVANTLLIFEIVHDNFTQSRIYFLRDNDKCGCLANVVPTGTWFLVW